MSTPSEVVEVVSITADTVRRGDIITIGGEHFRVLNLLALHSGAKRVTFHTGETLTMHGRTRMNALRLVPPSMRPYRHRGRPIPSTPEHLRAALDEKRLPRAER
jgi:hypothetical protein